MIELSKRLLRVVGRTNAHYGLIQENDKLLLGLSGGKDSLTLAHILKHMQRVAPFHFEFKAVTIAYGMGEDLQTLHAHCLEHEIDHEIVDTSIFELAQEKIRSNSSFCSFFSRMRRGALYTYALNNGYAKLALAHHLDDAAESFFMNFSYNGALRSMPPIYKAQNGLVVIRPLIHVRERQLRECAKEHDMPVIGDEACPAMRFDVKMPVMRAKTKEMLAAMEKENPELFVSLKKAFESLQVSSFCDERYLDR
ncbi:ATP-binding protein [Sulfurospirillum sp. hDNRA2]|uniref:ATP-binding protein n=1 Tax=Sulfurospirillum TaxID=57665 RepID=UPI0020B6C183|nr:ATP-binding protein [Sulfurospirillum sp. DNRA8]MCP3651954.1 tRNA 2-thiocytidine biosynthesis protein TtcA [Sulfurospirillum sp. DNRA8]MCR1810801.1 tRNA 2-thiocytidine biosynthesis protein TtcA [Sulfurospirillum sp. DNRA8]